MGNKLRHTVFRSAVSHIEISSKSCDHSQSDCLRGNHDVAHGNLPKSPDPSFPVRGVESNPHWGWLDLACETNVLWNDSGM